jgi:hypothetical protein
VIMFKPISCACDIASKITWLPCPSRFSKCLLVKETPFGTYFLRKKRNSLNKKNSFKFLFTLSCKSLVSKV